MNNNDDDGTPIRQTAGSTLTAVSDAINDNLALARAGTIVTVGILAAYGISQTPLFFRYYNIGEIPQTYFAQRKSIHGRLIKVNDNDSNNGNNILRVSVRHLSLAERFLSTKNYDRLWQYHPVQLKNGPKVDENKNQLLQCQIANIQPIRNSTRWLESLAKDKVRVKVQFLARKTVSSNNIVKIEQDKRRLAEFTAENSTTKSPQLALVRLYVYDGTSMFFPTDIAVQMVKYGRALPSIDNHFKVDNAVTTKDLQDDTKYMDKLSNLECQAAAQRRGMWADASFRQEHASVVDEADFRTKAPLYKKLWRWMRGG